MKHKGSPPALPAVALVVMVLAVLTALTTPLTIARYSAAGTLDASARVATWDVFFTEEPSEYATAYLGGALKDASPEKFGISNSRTLTIKNNSEVAAEITAIRFRGERTETTVTDTSPACTINADDEAIASITLDTGGSSGVTDLGGGRYRFAIGAEAKFEVKLKAVTPNPSWGSASTDQNNNSCIRRYKVFFDVEQID